MGICDFNSIQLSVNFFLSSVVLNMRNGIKKRNGSPLRIFKKKINEEGICVKEGQKKKSCKLFWIKDGYWEKNPIFLKIKYLRRFDLLINHIFIRLSEKEDGR